MSLSVYNKKRDFSNTPEPRGINGGTSDKRFVVQYHRARAKHYDFRLEHDGVLVSWAVPKGLSTDANDKRLAIMVEDHPVDYIDFEGIIPKGNYGAGTVEIFDSGKYKAVTDLSTGLKKGHVKIALFGRKLKGVWSLIKIKDDNWLAVKASDSHAKKQPEKNTSLPFLKCKAMLATLSSSVPEGKNWVFEIKYDGYRILSFSEKGKVSLFSRNGTDYTAKFPAIARSLSMIEQASFAVDGEVVCFDKKGRSDFGLLQRNIKKGAGDFYYIIFDLLSLNGEDLRSLPLSERKAVLERTLFGCEKNLMYSAHVNDGKKCLEFTIKNKLEGIVAKNVQSPYVGERSKDWLKIKNASRQEFVVAGYSTTEKNPVLSALYLGYYKEEKLIYAGKVGTGIDDRLRGELIKKFKKLKTKSCPFDRLKPGKNVSWLKPELVAEIKFAEFTKDGILRQPSFIGLREDKQAKDVFREGL